MPPQTPSPPCQTANGPPPVVGHLVPARDVVVEARADDPERDTPDGDAQDEVPVAAEPRPANPGQPDARRDREQQHQAVHVDVQRPDVDDAGRRRGDGGDSRHRQGFCPCRRIALARNARGGCGARYRPGSRAREARRRGGGRRRGGPPARRRRLASYPARSSSSARQRSMRSLSVSTWRSSSAADMGFIARHVYPVVRRETAIGLGPDGLFRTHPVPTAQPSTKRARDPERLRLGEIAFQPERQRPVLPEQDLRPSRTGSSRTTPFGAK